MKPKHKLVLLTILLIATFFRFYLIREMPGGLFPDEAANGLDINLMDQGKLQPFYERGNGREALFFYMLWASVSWLGRGAWQHHVVSALIGVLSVLGCYLVTKSLFGQILRKSGEFEATENAVQAGVLSPTLASGHEDKPHPTKSFELRYLAGLVLSDKATILALIASFLMAVSSWHVVLSRTAFRANLVPLLATFALYFGLRVFIESDVAKKVRASILFGVFFALGFYSYISFRMMVPLMGIVVLWLMLSDAIDKPRLAGIKKYFSYAVISFIFFAITIAPLAHYFYKNPDAFIGRSGQVSVFNPELNGGQLVPAILEVTKQSFLGYFTTGDLNWRHNISGQPYLPLLVSPFFAIGLVLVTFLAVRYFFRPVRYASDIKHFILAGWFYGMLAPVIATAEGIPHGLRAIGTIPVVFIISAYGIYTVYTWVEKLAQSFVTDKPWKLKLINTTVNVIIIGSILALPLQTYTLYFVRAYNDPANFYAFRSDLTVVSDYLKKHGNRETTYLILDKFSVQTVDYFTTIDGTTSCDRTPAYRPDNCIDNPKNKPYIQVDPEESWRGVTDTKDGQLIWTYGLKRGDKIVFTQSSIFDIKKFKQHHPNSALIKEVRNKFGQAVMAVYEIQ